MIDKLIGNYRITAELAQGGMGAVYRGRHQNLPREVVVKAILLSSFPPRDQAHLKARFVREACVQSQLDHPNIVRVYEFFTTEENYYLVMEFIDGMSLRQLVQRRGALPAQHVLPLLKQALSALAYAHRFTYEDESGQRLSGIIHRDIKPANILLDGIGRLKITDFGIVKLAGETGMTRTGFNPGTVEYMSPEQIRGLVVDARSDLYSLGVTFYELLSGQLPFPPSDTGSEYEVMRGHTELPPPPLRALKPEVPPALADLVMRSLEKDPARRFQTADEWLEAILEYESQPVNARETAVGIGPQGSATNPLTEILVAEMTERLTEKIGSDAPETSLMPGQTTGSVSARPSSPSPPMQTSPPTSQANIPVAGLGHSQGSSKQKSSSSGILIGAAVVVVLMIAGVVGYFVWLRQNEPVQTTEAPAQVEPRVTASQAIVVAEDSRLRGARQAEQAERYPEAIRMYEEYVRTSPQAADVATVSKTVAELKSFNGHLQMAKVWMDQGDFNEAKKDFAAAVKVRPDSVIAKAGLAQADAKLKQK
ncbi:MAG: protein kinase [Acidobacteriota bacterium]